MYAVSKQYGIRHKTKINSASNIVRNVFTNCIFVASNEDCKTPFPLILDTPDDDITVHVYRPVGRPPLQMCALFGKHWSCFLFQGERKFKNIDHTKIYTPLGCNIRPRIGRKYIMMGKSTYVSDLEVWGFVDKQGENLNKKKKESYAHSLFIPCPIVHAICHI